MSVSHYCWWPGDTRTKVPAAGVLTYSCRNIPVSARIIPLQLRHNEPNGVSNHLRLDCLLNQLFRRKSKKTSKLRVTGLCEGNSPVTGEFPAQRTNNAENVSFWWRHHIVLIFLSLPTISYTTYRRVTTHCIVSLQNIWFSICITYAIISFIKCILRVQQAHVEELVL